LAIGTSPFLFVYLIRRQRQSEIQTDTHFPLELWPRCLQGVKFQVQQFTLRARYSDFCLPETSLKML
jgi:hypothetical protein